MTTFEAFLYWSNMGIELIILALVLCDWRGFNSK